MENAQEAKFKVMTESPVKPLVCRLAAPTIVSMLVTSFYNMADTFFVGQIGTSATAAVGSVVTATKPSSSSQEKCTLATPQR